MKLAQLECLVSTVDNGCNASKAAIALNVSQPVVSKHISNLSKELGFDIFNRNGKHLTSLTDKGRVLFAMSKKIVCIAEEIESLSSSNYISNIDEDKEFNEKLDELSDISIFWRSQRDEGRGAGSIKTVMMMLIKEISFHR